LNLLAHLRVTKFNKFKLQLLSIINY
jgi:hypothetical protein